MDQFIGIRQTISELGCNSHQNPWSGCPSGSQFGAGVQSLVASIFGSGLPKLLTFLLHDRQLLGPLPHDLGETPNLILGLILSVISVLSGTVLLIVAYFIAEEINVFANIAESLNNIETKLVDEEPTSDS